MNAIERVRIARAVLMQNVPIISYFAEELTIISAVELPRCCIDTAAVSRNGICVFNESFVDTLNDRELAFVLAHEALHWGLDIFTRTGFRDPFVANIAHDYVVNAILVDIGNFMLIPDDVLYERDYANLSFEEVYEKIDIKMAHRYTRYLEQTNDARKARQKMVGGPGYDCTSSEDIDSNYAKKSGVNREEMDRSSDFRREHALSKSMQESDEYTIGMGRGNYSEFNAAYEIIKKIIDPSPRFIDEVPNMIGRYGKRSLPSRRRRHHRNRFDGTHLPYSGLRPAQSILYLLIDTSGSMWFDKTLLQKSLGIILRLVSEQQMELVIVQCDTLVQFSESGTETVQKILSGELKLFGHGGSDFTPAFEWMIDHAKIHNDGKMPVVAITDGDIGVPDTVRGVYADILWVGNAPTKSYGRQCSL